MRGKLFRHNSYNPTVFYFLTFVTNYLDYRNDTNIGLSKVQERFSNVFPNAFPTLETTHTRSKNDPNRLQIQYTKNTCPLLREGNEEGKRKEGEALPTSVRLPLS